VAELKAGLIHYRLERRNADGSYSPTPPAALLAMDDAVRLSITGSSKGHLYLVDNSDPDTPSLLFSGVVDPGVQYLVPPQGGLPPPQNAGQRRLVLLFSRDPLPLDILGVTGKFDPKGAGFSREIALTYQEANP
jgi:hypothetical protein